MLRKILHYPNPKLRTAAKPIEKFDDELHALIRDMFETMYEDHGGGLAATQLEIHRQIFIIDPESDRKKQYIFINPEILETAGKIIEVEGCLSVPGICEKVTRANYVKIKAFDPQGKEFILEAQGDYLARCIQHEYDHLQGKLFIDHLSRMKQNRIRKRIEKMKDTVL